MSLVNRASAPRSVAGGRTSEHRLVGVERVLDLAIEIEIVLGRLRRHQNTFLQSAEVTDLSGDRRFREDARRFLHPGATTPPR